jgi:lipopolysaccharide/colanic/teichoic acid biosynthesis glycosyltransferase
MDRLGEAAIAPVESLAWLPPYLSKLRLRLQVFLILIDALVLVSAIKLAGIFWLGEKIANSAGSAVAAAFLSLYFLAGANAGAFTSDILVHRRRSVFLGARSVLLATAGVILAAFFLKTGAQISRMELVISGILGTFFVALARVVFNGWTRARFGSKLHTEVLILDGCSMPAPPGVHVLDAAAFKLRSDLTDPLMLDRIGRLLAPADRVVIACDVARRRNWAMVLKGANIQAEIVSPELTEIGPLGTGRFGDSATVVVAGGSLDLRQRMVKRCLDLALAIPAVLLLAPLLLCVAIAIRLDSPGPVFFVQDRVGRGNRLFGIYKFRSMRVDVCDDRGNRSASRDDDRITRIGRLIRATSIDELPQLFNILKGNMSFVGPRPHALGSLAGNQLFWEVDERYWHRHVCKPGMTGLAQVRGYRGATHRQSDLTNRLQADLEYVAGWTMLRDVTILIATLRVVVHRNAY